MRGGNIVSASYTPSNIPAPGGFGLVSVDRLCQAIPAGGITPVHLVRFTLEQFAPAAFDAYGIACPPAIARSVKKRQAEFFFGRLAARLALEPHGMGHREVASGASREPVWPAAIAGSISHNQRYAAAVAMQRTRHLGIGIDIESIIPDELQGSLIGHVVSPTELDYLRNLDPSEDLGSLLTLVFSAKESFFKAAFHEVGHFFDFDAVRIEQICLDTRALTLVIQQSLSLRLAAGTAVTVFFCRIDHDNIFTICRIP